MLTPVSVMSFCYRLLAAVLLGAIVGVERQWRQHMAGTRTNALVAAGASAFVMAGSLLVDDPSARGRVASYVVSGVGFLRAGVIFKDGANVRGLSTQLQSGAPRLPVSWRDWARRSFLSLSHSWCC
jgi:putative Mg2+ transporter-C (MgtC) family protein